VGNPSSVKVHFSITPKTSGEHTFSVQAYGRCTLKVGSKSWSYESESNALDYLVAMGINRKLEQVHLQAGEKVDVEFDYRPFDSDGTLSRTRFVSFKLGFDEYCDEDKMMQEAAEVAKDADVAIVFTATGQEYETEGFDRPHMKLPRRQDDLVEAILKVQPKKTIVVNLTGSAVEMPWVDNIPALVQAWFPGQECGRAIAEVLLGQGRAGGPTGRMPSTWPKKIEDHASYGNFPIDTEDDPKQPVVHYKERKLVGHKWYEEKDIEPQFWLGEGLSYTTWKRTLVSSEGSITSNGGRVTVKVLVENTGKRSGKDVVQIYMKPDQASKDKPKRSLAAFATVLLNPGESQTVTLQFDQEAVSYWEHGENGHWKVEKGIYEVSIGINVKISNQSI
jgi:beta-glucosidase